MLLSGPDASWEDGVGVGLARETCNKRRGRWVSRDITGGGGGGAWVCRYVSGADTGFRKGGGWVGGGGSG